MSFLFTLVMNIGNSLEATDVKFITLNDNK